MNYSNMILKCASQLFQISYEPDYLLDEDIVLVTINYRLGMFGFMSTEDRASPGNYGMLDQVNIFKSTYLLNISHVSCYHSIKFCYKIPFASLQVAALRWVKANIEAFSGDPRHITIMGQQVATNYI